MSIDAKQTYSPITSMHVTNFMSIRTGEFHFDESGIVKILGYNNSGKSAMLRALAVALTYRWASKHKQFIHDDARYFQVDVNFADGVTIRFEKHASGTSLYEMYKDNELIFTTMISKGNYQKIEGVPEIIEKYLGIMSTPDGINLSYGVNTDKQLLVETSGSENYQALNIVLKSEELSRAVKLLNTDNNTLNGEIHRVTSVIAGVQEEIQHLHGLDNSLVAGAKSYDATVKGYETRVAVVEEAATVVHELAQTPIIPVLPAVDTSRVELVGTLANAAKAVTEVESIPTIPQIDGSKLESLETIKHAAQGIADTPDIPVLESVSDARVKGVAAVADVMKAYTDEATETDRLATERAKVEGDIKELVTQLRADGHVITECPSCGEVHLADVA